MNFLTVDSSDKTGDAASVSSTPLEPISVKHKGRAVNVTLRDGSTIIAAIAEDKIYAPGDEIGLRFNPAQAQLFAQEQGGTSAAHQSGLRLT